MNDWTGIAIVSAFIAFLGLIFLIVAIVINRMMKKKQLRCSAKTIGKVKELKKEVSVDIDSPYASDSYLYRPVFEYHVGEKEFIKNSYMATTPPKFKEGQEIEVYYNPDNYSEFYVVGENVYKIMSIVCVGVGALLIMLAIFVFLVFS